MTLSKISTKFLVINKFLLYCVKNVRIRSFSGRYTYFLLVFSPNTGKYGPEKTPNTDTFHAALVLLVLQMLTYLKKKSLEVL